MANIYANRNHQALCEHYLRHIDRMTVEGLHSKSAIAGELAWRDKRIADLEAMLADVEASKNRWMNIADQRAIEVAELKVMRLKS